MKHFALIFLVSLFNAPLAWAQTHDEAQQATPIEQTAPALAPDLTKIEVETPADTPMQFSLYQIKPNWIIAEGLITSDTPQNFISFLQDNNIIKDDKALAHKIIVLHSNGGDKLAAMALGQDIRRLGFDTSIAATVKNDAAIASESTPDAALKLTHGVCKDACFLAFLGGNSRSLDEGQLEMQTYRPPLDGAGNKSGQEVDVQKQQLADIAYIVNYAYKMKFDPRVVFIDWQNPKPHIFSIDEMLKYGIIFNAKIFSKWTLEAADKTLIALSKRNDENGRARIYCNMKNKRVVVDLIQNTAMSQQEFDNFDQNVKQFSVFNVVVAKDKTKIYFQNGQLEASFTLPKIKPNKLIVTDPLISNDHFDDKIVFTDIDNIRNSLAAIAKSCQ